MFVGSINKDLLAFLSTHSGQLTERKIIVGCSGNFTLEALFTQLECKEIHSNDVSFYSCLIGSWLTCVQLPFEIRDESFAWMNTSMHTQEQQLAAMMVLMDMLPFEKQQHAHHQRMWRLYRESFHDLVQRTIVRLRSLTILIDSFFAGDVFDHFARFANQPDALFCCFAPTYARGYERMYKRLHEIVAWSPPPYTLLDVARRDQLLAWMRERDHIWIDDRALPDMEPIYRQSSNRAHSVYVYSNIIRSPCLLPGATQPRKLTLALADRSFVAGPDACVGLVPINPAGLSVYKDMFLNKTIRHARGMWAFAVQVDGATLGFLEFKRDKTRNHHNRVYMVADFPVSGTRYTRLSKLMVMLAISGQTRKLLERINERTIDSFVTTAFTDRPVSMKYRGVLELSNRGTAKDGQAFLNYQGTFNQLTWQDTWALWLNKHGSLTS